MRFVAIFALLIGLLGCQTPSSQASAIPGPSSENLKKLYVKTYGDLSRPTFVFLHGGPGFNSFDFEFGAASQLADSGYGVVVFDQLGSGRSEAGHSSDYTFSRATSDLREIIVSLNLVKPILIGHSFGGTIGLQFLERYPGVAAGLVLVSSPVSYPDLLADSLDTSLGRFEWLRAQAPDQCATQACFDKAHYVAKLSDTRRLRNEMFVDASHKPRDLSPEKVSSAFVTFGEAGLYFPLRPTQEAISIYQTLAALDTTGLLGANQSNQTTDGSPYLGYMRNEGNELGTGYVYLDLGKLVSKHQLSIFGIYGKEDGLFSAAHLNRIESLLLPGRMTRVDGASHAVYIHSQETFLKALATAAAELRK